MNTFLNFSSLKALESCFTPLEKITGNLEKILQVPWTFLDEKNQIDPLETSKKSENFEEKNIFARLEKIQGNLNHSFNEISESFSKSFSKILNQTKNIELKSFENPVQSFVENFSTISESFSNNIKNINLKNLSNPVQNLLSNFQNPVQNMVNQVKNIDLKNLTNPVKNILNNFKNMDLKNLTNPVQNALNNFKNMDLKSLTNPVQNVLNNFKNIDLNAVKNPVQNVLNNFKNMNLNTVKNPLKNLNTITPLMQFDKQVEKFEKDNLSFENTILSDKKESFLSEKNTEKNNFYKENENKIQVASLIENFNIHVGQLENSGQQLKEQIQKILTEAVQDVQLL